MTDSALFDMAVNLNIRTSPGPFCSVELYAASEAQDSVAIGCLAVHPV